MTDVILGDINIYGNYIQQQKAEKFLQLKKVKQVAPNEFVVEHIEGYNKKDKHVKVFEGNFICDCFWYIRHRKECSHSIAVKMFIKRSEAFRTFVRE